MVFGDEMDRANIEKIAHDPQDKMLLAKLWDKINYGINRNVPAHTCFLSPRELEMARYLFGDVPGLHAFGGFPDAERKMLCYLPDYMEETVLLEADSPIICLHTAFYEGDTPTHRDFLGSLMGAGIARETVGDICVGKGQCVIFVSEEISQYLLQNFTNAGRTKFRLSQISLHDASIPEPEVKIIKDTLASLRLDGVVSSGFRISRALASQAISAGKVTVDGLPCEKPDKPVIEGCKISLRGSGKIKLEKVNGQTKKGRISVEIHRYM